MNGVMRGSSCCRAHRDAAADLHPHPSGAGRARRRIDLDFFTQMPKPVGEAGGGMANAIVGTLILIGDRVGDRTCPSASARGCISPRTAGRGSRTSVRFLVRRAQRTAVDRDGHLRLAVPRAGRIGHFSALAGGIALGAMMIPLVTRTTEEMVDRADLAARSGARTRLFALAHVAQRGAPHRDCPAS